MREIRRLFPRLDIAVRQIRTLGDLDQRTSLTRFRDAGLFVKEIEEALIAGTIDMAVHSMKDLPTNMHEELTIGAVPPREDARDALVSRSGLALAKLKDGAVVGTSSARRQAQVLRLRPSLQVKPLRGNVDTRLRKLDEGQYDAIVLAMAGLVRMGHSDRATQVFDVETMVPAAGQGALAVQLRRDDSRIEEIVAPLNHAPSETAVKAERAFLARLGGGCQIPTGAYGTVQDSTLTIAGCVCHPRGEPYIEDRLAGNVSEAEQLGVRLAERLLAQGASRVMDELL